MCPVGIYHLPPAHWVGILIYQPRKDGQLSWPRTSEGVNFKEGHSLKLFQNLVLKFTLLCPYSEFINFHESFWGLQPLQFPRFQIPPPERLVSNSHKGKWEITLEYESFFYS